MARRRRMGHYASMSPREQRVWIDGWQMECCGAPFEVGSRVEWTCGTPDFEWLSDALDDETPRSMDAAEDHHGPVAHDDLGRLSGTVRTLNPAV